MQVDFNGVETLGAVQGILATADTKVFADDVVRIQASNLAGRFDGSVYRMAVMNKDRFHHVYEWSQIGNPRAKLWRHRLEGTVGKRQMTFDFIPSVTNAPPMTPENTGVEQQYLSKLRKNGKYKFPNKARVFEYGIRTRIAPRHAQALFIPLRGKVYKPRSSDEDAVADARRINKRGFLYVKRPVEQDHSDQPTVGAFTKWYLTWIESNSERVFEQYVKPRIESRIRKVYLANLPNMGGSNVVRRGGAGTRKLNLAAISNAQAKTSRALEREMAQAVKEAEWISQTT